MRIVVIPSSGFGNRMRMLASCQILAESLNMQVGVVWIPTDDCQIQFADIFSANNVFTEVAIEYVTSRKYYYKGHVHTSGILPDLMRIFNEYEVLLLEGGHEFKLPSMNVEEFMAKKSDFYRSVKFSRQVTDLVDTYQNRLGNKYIAIHYRDVIPQYDAKDIANTPNNVISPVSFNQNSPITSFYKLLDRFVDTLPFLVVSNNPTVINYLKTHAKTKTLLKTDFNATSRSDRKEMLTSVVEFILMSRAMFIIGSYYSSFSDEASFFNQIPKLMPISRDITDPYHCHGFGVLKFSDSIGNLYGLNLQSISGIRDLFTNKNT